MTVLPIRKALHTSIVAFVFLFASSHAWAESFVPDQTDIVVPENSSFTLSVSLNPPYSSTEELDAQVTFGPAANINISGGLQTYLNGVATHSWIINVGEQNSDEDVHVTLIVQTMAVRNGAAPAPNYNIPMTITVGGTTTDTTSDPDVQQAAAVNLTATKSISSFVINQVFLQPVRPTTLRILPPATDNGDQGFAPQDSERVNAMPVLANVPPPQLSTWNLSVHSAARYARTEYYDFDHSHSDRAGVSFQSSHNWDRWSLDVTVPLDIVHFDGQLDDYDYWRTGVIAIPRYSLLEEERHGVDLTVGGTAYYLRTDMRNSKYANPDHAGAGAMVSMQKTFGDVSVSGGVIAQRAWNFDGRDEVTGNGHVDITSGGLNVGLPLGDNLAVNAMFTYMHISNTPEWMDADTGMAGVNVSYMVADKWTLDTSLMHDVFNEDESNVEIHTGLSWQF